MPSPNYPAESGLSGPLGWFAWLALHLVMLVGFRNRLNVLVNWAWNYLTYDRASRIIPDVATVRSTAPHEDDPARAHR